MRIPFASQTLYHWDSVNFARATEYFNIAAEYEQPQPPGYLLYVLLGRLLNLVTHDPQISFVSISIAASGAAIALFFWLADEMFDRRTAWIAALLLLANPLFWFYGEIALPHALDLALVVASVTLLYSAAFRAPMRLLGAAFILAVAGGIRPQTLVFLLPLYAYTAWHVGWRRRADAHIAHRRDGSPTCPYSASARRYALAATLLLLGGCLGWFIPLITLSGGFEQYVRILADYSMRFQQTTSIFHGAGLQGALYNLDRLVRYTLYGLALGILPPLFVLWQRKCSTLGVIREQRSTDAPAERLSTFLGLWVLPPLVFYLLVHMGQQGLIFVFLPALLLISASSLAWLMTRSRFKTVAWALFAVILAFNVYLFILAPEYPFASRTLRLLNWNTLRHADARMTGLVNAIRANLAPSQTLILAANWRHAEYYLPEYRVLRVPERGNARYTVVPSDPQQLALFDHMQLEGSTDASAKRLSAWLILPPDADTPPRPVIRLNAGDVLYYSPGRVRLVQH